MREFLATDASNSVAQTRSLRYYYVREHLTLGVWGPIKWDDRAGPSAAEGVVSDEFTNEQKACRQGAEQSH